MQKINSSEFNDFVSSGKKVVQFSATWCGPCKMLSKTLENFDVEGVEIAKLDIDESRDLAMKFGVRSVPLLVLFENGEEVRRSPGAKPYAEVVKFVEGK